MPADDYPRRVPPEVTAATEIVAVGGRVTAEMLRRSYAAGVFPMDAEVAPGITRTTWISPEQRAIMTFPGMPVSRSLRRSMRRFTITYDAAFAGVLEGCADPSRPHGWITADYRRAYTELAREGSAHSVEVWQGQTLVGGLIGVELGGLFCADSMFRRVTDASKAAVAGLSQRVFEGEFGPRRAIDAQWLTDHLATLGFRAVPRDDYVAALPALLALPGAFAAGTAGKSTV